MGICFYLCTLHTKISFICLSN